MEILIKKSDILIPPTRAYDQAAAWDVYAISEPKIVGEFVEFPSYGFGKLWKSIDYIEYDTGLCIEPKSFRDKDGMLRQFFTILASRSSISNKNLNQCNGVGIIDPDYKNSILIRFNYVFQPEDLVIISEYGANRFYTKINQEKIYHKGNRIAQLFISELISSNLKFVDKLTESLRGEKCFGSSGN